MLVYEDFNRLTGRPCKHVDLPDFPAGESRRLPLDLQLRVHRFRVGPVDGPDLRFPILETEYVAHLGVFAVWVVAVPADQVSVAFGLQVDDSDL